jgi:hypothetical protein
MDDKEFKDIQPHSTYNKSTDKIRNFIKDNMSKIMLVAIVLTYVGQGCFELVQREWDISAFIGRMGASLIVGMSIYTNMRMNGLSDGRKTLEFMASYNLYAQTKQKVSKTKQYKLNAFCMYKNEQSVEEAKQDLLEEYGLQYRLWKNGSYNAEGKLFQYLDAEQKKCLNYVNTGKVKTFGLNTRFLLSDSPKLTKKDLMRGKFSRDEKDYTRSSLTRDIFTMLFWSIIFSGYILMPIINGETLPSILWNTWQVICWIAGGVSKYQDAKDFMVNEYRQTHLVYKTEVLGEFLSIMEHDESMLDSYDYIGNEIKRIESEEKKDGTSKE